ncbi:MAG: PAS domain S-box protein [Anaerolineales bacterium]|nr:PAS domain S-box protein [Anaerolineales bacterium]MCK5635246.1 PAS domain S-box protein [Anaerolineales bacterium]
MLPDFRIRQRDYLLSISRAITEELDLDRVLTEIVRFSAEILGGSAGLIALRDAGGAWRVATTFGINPDFVQHLDPLISDIPDHGDPARFEVPEINRRLQRITQAASMGLLTGVGLPMNVKGEIVGVIFVFRSYRGQFSADDRKLLSAFASQAAIAVHNAMLFTEIAQQHHHLDAILESAADGIFILDPSYRFTRFNRACSSLMGYEADSVIGKQHKEIIRWLDREPGISLEDAEADGWPLSPQATLYVEGDLLTKGGGAVSVGITYAPALDDAGDLLSIVATVRDITKFREAEELKSTFISIISHELRTPVALIKGYVGTLRREDARWDSQVVEDSLAVIEEETDHLSGLIDDLLDASRLQAGALKLNRSQIALDHLAKQMADRFKTQSDHHNFETDFPTDFPIVYADENRLMQVMGNLLSNAVKYSPDGGKVTTSGAIKRNEIVVCVQDEGPGIAAEDVPRIFNLFYRSSETSRKIKGAGLGLFLAKAVIEAHDGQIWVDDRVKNGARICFSLPISKDTEGKK